MIRVLVIEDDPADARFIHEMLKEHDPWNYYHTRVDTLAAAVNSLKEQRFDVVLLDLGLPDAFGPEAIDRLLEVAPAVPIVIISGLDEEAFALQAVQRGAQDYIVKGKGGAEQLARSIKYAIVHRRRANRALEARPVAPGIRPARRFV